MKNKNPPSLIVLRLRCPPNILILNNGVSDSYERLYMNKPVTEGLYRNRGANSFLHAPTDNMTEVTCKPLIEIVDENKIKFVTGMKLDIEGFEHKVLSHYFENCSKLQIPKFIILEQHPKDIKSQGDSIELLKGYGFSNSIKTKYNNYVMFRK